MAPRTVPIVHKTTWNALQNRIDQLEQEKVRLLVEWDHAMKRVHCAPPPYRHDALQTVRDKYSDLVDALEAHITTLQASRGEFTPRIDRLLTQTKSTST
jgi:hypothetical protein